MTALVGETSDFFGQEEKNIASFNVKNEFEILLTLEIQNFKPFGFYQLYEKLRLLALMQDAHPDKMSKIF